MTEAPITATLKAGGGYDAPWLVVRADTPDQLTQRLNAIVEHGIDAALVVAAQSLAREWGGNAAPAPTASGQTNVEQHLGGQVIQDSAGFTPAPSTNANPAPAAPAAGITVEEDKWGGRYELNLPNAPQTPFGPAIKVTKQAKSGKYYSRWEDPRIKALPSNYQAGVREDPADRWEGDFVR